VKRALALFLGLAVLPLAACGGGGEAQDEWSGPPAAGADGALAVDAFNDFLDEYPEYAESPFEAATEFLRLDERTAGETSLVATTEGESPSPVSVVVTLDRLADDSVRAQRYELVFEDQGDDGWRLVSGVETQRCQQGRGHQSFSPEPCV
jgi:hypothetical protein